MTVRILVLAALLGIISYSSHVFAGNCVGKEHRSSAVARHFMLQHPCPGGPDKWRIAEPCQGFVIDHIIPLCACGADAVTNMQWQTVAAAKAKDVLERRECGLQH